MLKRLRRRIDEYRLKRRMLKRLKRDEFLIKRTDNEELEKIAAKQASVHGAYCSCWMCGNPRRHFGRRSFQEENALLKIKEDLENLDDQDD